MLLRTRSPSTLARSRRNALVSRKNQAGNFKAAAGKAVPFCSPRFWVLGAPALLSVLAWSQQAAADVTSFYEISPGISVIDQSSVVTSFTLDARLGLGTPATHPWVFGGVFELGSHFAVGADLGGSARLCTASYVKGEWGYGFDLGAHYRFADEAGAAGSLRAFVGLPWGVVVGLGGSYQEGGVLTSTLSVGVDFARLTVHRGYGTETLPSPLHSPEAPPESPRSEGKSAPELSGDGKSEPSPHVDSASSGGERSLLPIKAVEPQTEAVEPQSEPTSPATTAAEPSDS